MIKNLPVNAGDAGLISGMGRFPGEGNDNCSSTLAWKIPWTEDPCELQPWGHKSVDHAKATKQQQI